MKNYLKLSLLVSLSGCATALSAAPFLELGEDAQLHLLADVGFVYKSNLFLSSTDAVSGRYLDFSPGVELRLLQQGSASAVLRYQHQFTRYRDQRELDDDFSHLDLRAQYNSGVVMASGYARYDELFSSTIDANRDKSLVQRDRTGVGGAVRYELSELTAFKVGFDYDDVDYEDSVFTDYDSVSVPLTFFYKVRPRVDLTGGLRYRTTNTSGGLSSSYDFEDMYYFVGAVGELFSPVLYADITVGFQERESDGSSLDTSSASYDITVIYTGDVKTTIYGGLSRDYRTSAAGGLSYAFTNASLGARYSFTESIGFNAGIVVGETEYQESPRAEDMTILNLGASYSPNDYMTLSAGYKFTEVDGANVFSSDYDDTEIRVTASLRY